MATQESIECIGNAFLVNLKPKPVSVFSDDLLHTGSSIYEVIRLFDKKPLFLKEHLRRLEQSSKLSGIPLIYSKDQIIRAIKELIQINPFRVGNIKLLIRVTYPGPDFIAFFDCHKYPSQKDYHNGIKTGIYKAERINPNVKTVNMSLRNTTRERMKEEHYYEVFLENKYGNLTEGSRSNLFFIAGKKIYTPPLRDVLPGITREKIIDICRKLNLPLEERPIPVNSIDIYESAFITGTSPKVLPVKSVEKQTFVVDNQITQEIQRAYDRLIDEDIHTLQGWS